MCVFEAAVFFKIRFYNYNNNNNYYYYYLFADVTNINILLK